jgi:hypothetical protein
VNAGTAPAPWAAALLTMARELWVLRDRQRILEQLLAERGVLAMEALERYAPPPGLQAELDRECRAFVDRIAADLEPAGS